MAIKGKVWKYGDDVNTDVIFPGKYTYTIKERADMAKVACEDLDIEFTKNAKPGDIIIVMAVGSFNRLAYELKEML